VEACPSGSSVSVTVSSTDDIVTTCEVARVFARSAGISSFGATEATTAVAEVTRNMVAHAPGGTVEFRLVEDGRRRGMAVSAVVSSGQGIGPDLEDVAWALLDGGATAPGPEVGPDLGLSLVPGPGPPGGHRLMDDFTVESRPGVGTTVEMTKWAKPHAV
jgi:serine/threonine-protein kinase RsbT